MPGFKSNVPTNLLWFMLPCVPAKIGNFIGWKDDFPKREVSWNFPRKKMSDDFSPRKGFKMHKQYMSATGRYSEREMGGLQLF